MSYNNRLCWSYGIERCIHSRDCACSQGVRGCQAEAGHRRDGQGDQDRFARRARVFRRGRRCDRTRRRSPSPCRRRDMEPHHGGGPLLGRVLRSPRQYPRYCSHGRAAHRDGGRLLHLQPLHPGEGHCRDARCVSPVRGSHRGRAPAPGYAVQCHRRGDPRDCSERRSHLLAYCEDR